MDLLIIPNNPKSMNFIIKLNRGHFYLSSYSFEIWCFIRGWKVPTNTKFHLYISKVMPVIFSKKHRDYSNACGPIDNFG